MTSPQTPLAGMLTPRRRERFSGAMTCHDGKPDARLSATESNGKEAGHGERRDPA